MSTVNCQRRGEPLSTVNCQLSTVNVEENRRQQRIRFSIDNGLFQPKWI